jgi:hypothetical protein
MTCDRINALHPPMVFGVRLDHERSRARKNANASRDEASAAYAMGNRIAGDTLLLVAQIYEDSFEYWDEELRHLQKVSSDGKPTRGDCNNQDQP